MFIAIVQFVIGNSSIIGTRRFDFDSMLLVVIILFCFEAGLSSSLQPFFNGNTSSRHHAIFCCQILFRCEAGLPSSLQYDGSVVLMSQGLPFFHGNTISRATIFFYCCCCRDGLWTCLVLVVLWNEYGHVCFLLM